VPRIASEPLHHLYGLFYRFSELPTPLPLFVSTLWVESQNRTTEALPQSVLHPTYGPGPLRASVAPFVGPEVGHGETEVYARVQA
jgi:hypothetical protein